MYYANSTDWAGTLQQITDNPNVPKYSPAVAVDSNGTVHVAWQEHTPGSADIFYANSISWLITLTNISNTVDNSYSATIAVDSSNVVHVAWEEGSVGPDWDIYYSKSGN
jgi:hypothetical protein